MKGIRTTLACALILGCALTIHAQTDYKGHRITKEGKVYFDGAHVGTLSKEGIITDAKGNHIALISMDGSLVSPEGKVLGRKGKDGRDYESVDGEIILTVTDVDAERAEIKDKKGNVIGYTHPSYKGAVSILHVFMTKPAKK